MSTVEVLYRDSSETDGVQPRGAGWHSREVQGKNETQHLERLTGELAEGDLVRTSGKTAKLMVHDGLRLRSVRRPDLRAVNSRRVTRGRGRVADGDLVSAWETCQHATDLLEIATTIQVGHRSLTACACDGAESVLRLVRRGEERPRRALRTARLWLAGVAALADVKRARVEAYEATTHYAPPYFDSYAASSASSAVDTAAHADSVCSAYAHAVLAAYSVASASAPSASHQYDDVDRSLAFFVRTRIHLWQACLASVMMKGRS